MKLIFILGVFFSSYLFAEDSWYKAYIYTEDARGCRELQDQSSCFSLKFGKVLFFDKEQFESLLRTDWVLLIDYAGSNQPLWVNKNDIVLQKDLELMANDFPIESYSWDGGESRMEYSFSKETKLKVVNYEYTQHYSCSLYSKGSLLEIRCEDIDSDETSTEVIRYKDGKLISSKCGGWCEIKYKDGRIDIRRFE
jgi:hypothetical protein